MCLFKERNRLSVNVVLFFFSQSYLDSCRPLRWLVKSQNLIHEAICWFVYICCGRIEYVCTIPSWSLFPPTYLFFYYPSKISILFVCLYDCLFLVLFWIEDYFLFNLILSIYLIRILVFCTSTSNASVPMTACLA